MRAVEENGGLTRAQLKPSGVCGAFETCDDGCVWNRKAALAQGFGKRDGNGGIRCLMTTAQAKQDVFVTALLRLVSRTHAPRLICSEHIYFTRINARRDSAISTTLENHVECGGRLRRDDSCHTGTNDRSLFSSDLAQCLAEIFLMIERDGCDGDDFSLRRRRRIETPAQTRLKNCKLDTRLAESHESDGRQMLEERRQRFKPAFIE